MKRFIILIATVIFSTISILFLTVVNNRVSVMNYLSLSENESIDFAEKINHKLNIKTPLVTDNERLIGLIEFISDNSTYQFLTFIDIENQSITLIDQVRPEYNLKGISKNNNNYLILLSDKKDKHNYLFYSIDNDLSFNIIDNIKDTDINSINAIAIHNNNPEVIVTKNEHNYVSRLRYNKSTKNWQEIEIVSNAFFDRITKHLASFYSDNSWNFIRTSNFRKSDNIYVPAGNNNVNLFVFKQNIIFHGNNNIFPYSKTNISEYTDITFSGILSDINCIDFPKYLTVNNNIPVFVSCKDSLLLNNLFYFDNSSLKRIFNFIQKDDEKLEISKLYFDDSERMLISSELKNNYISLFRNSQAKPIARTHSEWENIFIIPQNNLSFVLLNNGYYCLLNNKSERIDRFSFKQKILYTIDKASNIFQNEPNWYKAYSLPFIFLFYPLSFFAAFLLFFIKTVFFTKKKPSYSKRYVRKAPFSLFWMPFCLIYIIGTFLFSISFVSLLKIL